MSTDPPRHPDDPPPDPDPGFELADEGYGFADEPGPLPPRPRPALPPAADEPEPPAEGQPSEDRPRRRRRRKREPNEGEADEVLPPEDAPQPGDRILAREEVTTPPGWWIVPAILIGLGLILCAIPIGVLAAERGAATGAGAVVLTVFGVVVQVTSVTALLMLIGGFFGIDYGPAKEAVLKLAAVVVLVDGLTFTALLCNPCGLVLAALVGVGVFQYLFRLAIHEMLLSVAPMVAAAWILNASVVAILAEKATRKNSAAPAAHVSVDVPVGQAFLPALLTPGRQECLPHQAGAPPATVTALADSDCNATRPRLPLDTPA